MPKSFFKASDFTGRRGTAPVLGESPVCWRRRPQETDVLPICRTRPVSQSLVHGTRARPWPSSLISIQEQGQQRTDPLV